MIYIPKKTLDRLLSRLKNEICVVITSSTNTERFREFQKFMHSLYNEGGT